MPEDTFEDIRERLFEAAWEEPAYATNRERVVLRARRRAATTIAGGILAVVAAVVVAASTFPTGVEERTARDTGGDRILLVDLATGQARETHLFPSDASFFEVAPNGGRVAFLRGGDRPQIWVAGTDGSNLRRVTRDPYGAAWPAWSPDGRQLAYLGYEGAGHPTLFIVDIRSREARKLLPESDDEPRAPAWSPDGTKIAYHVDREAPRVSMPPGSTGPILIRSHLRIVDVSTGRVRRVADHGVSSFDPYWLPDGRLVFMRTISKAMNRIDRCELWVADADGEHQRKLATVARDALAWGTRVSPDGARVTFVVQAQGEPQLQFVYDLATGSIRRLTEAYGAVWLDRDTLLLEAPPATGN